jgi:hypothetical protein
MIFMVLMGFTFLIFGTVQKTFPPAHPFNISVYNLLPFGLFFLINIDFTYSYVQLSLSNVINAFHQWKNVCVSVAQNVLIAGVSRTLVLTAALRYVSMATKPYPEPVTHPTSAKLPENGADVTALVP